MGFNMQKGDKDKLEIRIWSINLIIAWLILSAITFADFGASIIPILETGSRNDISGDLAASIFVLILFLPPFVITEEVDICRRSYISNPVLRPLYAFTLVYLAITALAQLTFVLSNSVFGVFVALIIGRLAMCFLFHKYPMDHYSL